MISFWSQIRLVEAVVRKRSVLAETLSVRWCEVRRRFNHCRTKVVPGSIVHFLLFLGFLTQSRLLICQVSQNLFRFFLYYALIVGYPHLWFGRNPQ